MSPSARSPEERLAESIQRLLGTQIRHLRREAIRTVLTFPQVMAIQGIYRAGEVPATRWARWTGTRPSTVSELIDGLVRRGFVRRSRDPNDRRVVILSLTPKGRRLGRRLRENRSRWMSDAFRGLPTDDIERAIGLLDSLSERLGGPRPTMGVRGRIRGSAGPGGSALAASSLSRAVAHA